MTITTEQQLLSAAEGAQPVYFLKTAGRSSSAGIWTSHFDIAGLPSAGTLAGTSTTQGVVPDDTTVGCPAIEAFGSGLTGYITSAELHITTVGNGNGTRLLVADLLFKSGAHTFSAADTLASQPSYSARVPNLDYKGLQIWIECVTAITGAQSIAITYTNQDGVTGQTTGTVTGFPTGALVGRMLCLPLAPGDTGVQKIESVTSTVSTVGTFNVLVLRPLVTMRGPASGAGVVYLGPDQTCLPIVFATSALYFPYSADTGTTGIVEIVLQIARG